MFRDTIAFYEGGSFRGFENDWQVQRHDGQFWDTHSVACGHCPICCTVYERARYSVLYPQDKEEWACVQHAWEHLSHHDGSTHTPVQLVRIQRRRFLTLENKFGFENIFVFKRLVLNMVGSEIPTKCTICFEEFGLYNAHILKCGHFFCYPCLQQYTRSTYPLIKCAYCGDVDDTRYIIGRDICRKY